MKTLLMYFNGEDVKIVIELMDEGRDILQSEIPSNIKIIHTAIYPTLRETWLYGRLDGDE